MIIDQVSKSAPMAVVFDPRFVVVRVSEWTDVLFHKEGCLKWYLLPEFLGFLGSVSGDMNREISAIQLMVPLKAHICDLVDNPDVSGFVSLFRLDSVDLPRAFVANFARNALDLFGHLGRVFLPEG